MHMAIYIGIFSASCLYALLRGGAPERAVALVMILGVVASRFVLSPVPHRYQGVEIGDLIVDGLVLAAFLVIALRANRFWPMGMVMLHGMSVLAHLLKFWDVKLIRAAYLVMLAIWIYPQLLLLVLGTYRHRKRIKDNGSDPSWSGSWRR